MATPLVATELGSVARSTLPAALLVLQEPGRTFFSHKAFRVPSVPREGVGQASFPARSRLSTPFPTPPGTSPLDPVKQRGLPAPGRRQHDSVRAALLAPSSRHAASAFVRSPSRSHICHSRLDLPPCHPPPPIYLPHTTRSAHPSLARVARTLLVACFLVLAMAASVVMAATTSLPGVPDPDDGDQQRQRQQERQQERPQEQRSPPTHEVVGHSGDDLHPHASASAHAPVVARGDVGGGDGDGGGGSGGGEGGSGHATRTIVVAESTW